MSDFAIFWMCVTVCYVAHLFFRAVKVPFDHEARITALETAVWPTSDDTEEAKEGT